ncbi:5' nucleotidase, NT5C type [Calidithermus chliarophilus]|uniref:5' nucleotidase, NT5C type n=1 Tax=Calidithermus chliarophilus TaxID=52023 RepID=UPI0003F7F71C|nr:hypothetical protein [Calidithermus chliarophilus]
MFALDLDGTVSDTLGSLGAYLSRALGVAVGLDRATNYHALEEALPPELRERGRALIERAFRDNAGNVYGQAEAVPGALEGARLLEARGKLAGYITRRPAIHGAITLGWLGVHGFPDAPLLHARPRISKAVYMRQLGARVLVEDSAHELEAVLTEGLGGVLLERPYNRGYAHERLVRLGGWAALAGLLEAA